MELSEVRKNIDRVDSEIKKLFKERMHLADQVARIKAETDDEIFKPEREQAIIENLTGDVSDDILMEYSALIKRIMEISRKYQYGRTLELRDCFNINYVEGKRDFSTYVMLKSEGYLKEKLELGDAKVIYADDVNKMVEMIKSGEAEAGLSVLEDIGVGVSDDIHSVLCTNDLYINKCVIVNDDDTKKKLVTFSDTLFAAEKDNRVKIMFVCHNRSGSLASVLSMIADYGVNLTEIHSKPYISDDWNYIFMLEMTASLFKKEDRALLYQLSAETQFFKCLGSYYCE